LRFTRDKRGYENTFVVHTGGARRRGKGRPRILYWFRTPPGVRIGRSALDESAIRLIEEHNPDVEFDWTRILKGQDAAVEPGGPPPDRRSKPRRDFPSRSAPQPSSPDVQRHRQPPPPQIEATAVSAPPAASPIESAEASIDEVDVVHTPVESVEIADVPEPAASDAGSSTGAGGGNDESLFDNTPPPAAYGPAGDNMTAAQARLGSEGLSRLRARHAEVLARISEIVMDQVRRDELKSRAERLNPDTWVTDAEVTEGLESYETVFESLRGVVGRRHKRRRRSGRRPGPSGLGGAPDAVTSDSGEEAAVPEDDGEDL
jgi:hypothetical protein